MPNGYFDLSGFDQLGDNDILRTNLNESGEFDSQSYAKTGADNGVPDPKAQVPAAGSATLEDGEKGPKPPQNTAMTGETQVKPEPGAGREMGPSIPQKTEISLDDYKASMRALQQSFNEGVKLIQLLESCTIVEKTAEQKQAEYMEEAMAEAMVIAYEDGPLFEAVKRDDKDDVKKIVRALRPKIKKEVKGDGLYFYDAKMTTRTMTAALTAAGGLAATAAATAIGPVVGMVAGHATAAAAGSQINAIFQQLWNTRLWQVLGIVHIENGNIKSYIDGLNETYKDELGEYKIIHCQAYPTIMDYFKVKFNWKNTKNCYFLLVDKKLPKEVKETIQTMEAAFKKAEEAKEKGKDGKSSDVKTESGCTDGDCGDEKDEGKKKKEDEEQDD